ncbi:MAG: trimethylamine methyltransferase family protein, partial [Pseudomonadota bacterium]
LPGGAAAGASDSKLPDMQAGWEQMCSNVMAGLSGLNMVYEAAGMHASLLGFCHESLVLGNDMVGQALRCVRGIEVTEDSVAVETIRQTVLGPDGTGGPGHYLGADQTLTRMQSDFVYPELGDRTSPKEWDENDKPDLLDTAKRRTAALLAAPNTAALPGDVDAAIRARFAIHLPA